MSVVLPADCLSRNTNDGLRFKRKSLRFSCDPHCIWIVDYDETEHISGLRFNCNRQLESARKSILSKWWNNLETHPAKMRLMTEPSVFASSMYVKTRIDRFRRSLRLRNEAEQHFRTHGLLKHCILFFCAPSRIECAFGRRSF
jgi:hypothetical protein